MFHLKKWYLDCATPDGTAVIAYWASARWGALRISYAGSLQSGPADSKPVASSTYLRPGTEPQLAGDLITWDCPALDCNGRWNRHCRAEPRTLFQSAAGSVEWSCIAPRTACTVRLGGQEFTGLGYVEVLEMSIAPWQLPIRELRWGRWLSEEASLVWIDWRGEHPLCLILDGGREVPGTVSDDAVSLHDGRCLTMNPLRTLRDGKLGATVLGAIPGLGHALPAAILQTHEQKWLSRGVLAPSTTNGFVIHERVVFGQ